MCIRELSKEVRGRADRPRQRPAASSDHEARPIEEGHGASLPAPFGIDRSEREVAAPADEPDAAPE